MIDLLAFTESAIGQFFSEASAAYVGVTNFGGAVAYTYTL